jgi:hypothetical protein
MPQYPACRSGNFLYLALVELKNIERRVAIEGELLGFPRSFPTLGPEALLGIEINAYAAELARVSVWIGEIQWMRRSGFDIGRKPILKPLDTIQRQNAIIAEDASVDVSLICYGCSVCRTLGARPRRDEGGEHEVARRHGKAGLALFIYPICGPICGSIGVTMSN